MKKYMLGMGMLCAASLAAAQTPKAEQAMDTKRQHIAAVDFLSNHPAVDADRIGVVGIWLGIVCDQIVRVCLTNWRFKSGKWTKIKI